MGTKELTSHIALLRGVNVGGRNRVPMPELRSLCAELGWVDVQTYIQSGNLVFRAAAAAAELERDVERAIARYFGLEIPAIVRTAAEWQSYVAGNPYADASRSEPNRVMMALSRAVPKKDAADALQARANSNERVVQVGDALWVHFGVGAGKSKLSPALFDRLVGSPVTMRNWRTVQNLDKLART
jgi:uncharacterized protein (DUF1697 family)